MGLARGCMEMGCYVFNRSSDVCRGAFVNAVERSLQPPPYKKLCVESNLKSGAVSGTSLTVSGVDPYEFAMVDGVQSRLSGEQSAITVSVTPVSKPAAVLNSSRRRAAESTELFKTIAASSQSVSTDSALSNRERTGKDVSTCGSSKLAAGPWLVKTQSPATFNGRLVNLPVGQITSQSQQVSRIGPVQSFTLGVSSQTVTLVQAPQPVSVIATSQPVSFVRTSQPVTHAGATQQVGVIGTSQTVSLIGAPQQVGMQRATFTLQPVRPNRIATNTVTTKSVLPVSLTVGATPVLTPAASVSAVQSIRTLSTATIPNGAFSRVQKVVNTLSADGGAEIVSSRQQSVATLLSLDKKPVIAPSSAPIGILLATPIVTTWQLPATNKDGIHRVISHLQGPVSDSSCRVIASTSQQRSQLSYVGQPCTVVERRPMILSKLRVSHGGSLNVVGDGGTCGQNSSVTGMSSKLLLHGVGGSVPDAAAHLHHQRKVSHQSAASSVASGADNNVLS